MEEVLGELYLTNNAFSLLPGFPVVTARLESGAPYETAAGSTGSIAAEKAPVVLAFIEGSAPYRFEKLLAFCVILGCIVFRIPMLYMSYICLLGPAEAYFRSISRSLLRRLV